MASPSVEQEPTCFTQAKTSTDWQRAMALELDALAQNQTWDLVPPPDNQHIVGCKWVYRIKRKADGTIERFKARLVAKCYTQEEGIDYTETFSPVVKPVTIQTLLSLAISKGWSLRQLDVNNAFLHGDLNEVVYMAQPPGFVNSDFPNHVCLLKKALYGLKQAPRAWFYRLRDFLASLGFLTSKSDSSLFIKCTARDVVYLLVYVDDIVIIGTSPSLVDHLISSLHATFTIKDLGCLSYFLGITATRSDSDLFSHSKSVHY
jgi:Reverse transcriptase (RNA-dependent DNA polymerase)